MSKVAKTEVKRPADIAQVTLLIDSSGSMAALHSEASVAIKRTMEEFATRKGMVFAIRQFDSNVETIADFGADLANTSVFYNPVGQETALYRAIKSTIELSVEDAKLTPDIKVHHVVVAITDGRNETRGGDLEGMKDAHECAAVIKKYDAKTTYILLDFSRLGNAGQAIGLKGIHFKNDPQEFKKAIDKVLEAIGQLADNVVKQLSPTAGLCLPPAR